MQGTFVDVRRRDRLEVESVERFMEILRGSVDLADTLLSSITP